LITLSSFLERYLLSFPALSFLISLDDFSLTELGPADNLLPMQDHASRNAVCILYAEDDPPSGRLVRSIAESEGYTIKVVATGKEFLSALPEFRPNLLLIDLHLPDALGLDLLSQARARLPATPAIVVTASASVEDVIGALKAGAIDYLRKPVDIQRMIVSLASAAKIISQQQDISQLRSELKETYRLEHMIGSSPEMTKVRELIRHAAPTDNTVLITGESGTGKELVAKALHYSSKRAAKPFIDVNCAALTETLIETELFGHEKGAFTSAITRRRGKFEQANGGTIFLDEIGDMPLSTQAKMLRVLQERSFERVGGEDKITVNVRVVCATNHNLEQAVKNGKFRLDLLYRINLFVIETPPLRDRPSDIAELARHFLATSTRTGKYSAQTISDIGLAALCAHEWPGNIRELQNAIERALTVCTEDVIQPCHLPPTVTRTLSAIGECGGSELSQSPDGVNRNTGRVSLIEAVEQFERKMILHALGQSRWNRSRAADSLGVTRRILSYKMQNLGIYKDDGEQ
jgi:DNA-binding NtrC family response regulator